MSKANKIIAVINRMCCQRKKAGYIESLTDSLKTRHGAKVIFTEYAGHATEIARDSSGYDVIIAGGGDGTIAEIVNGMDIENQGLGILPLGVGNSLARDLRDKNNPQKIDIIDCSFRIKNKTFRKYAVSTTGMGYVSEIVSFAKRHLRSTGFFYYPLSGFAMLFNQPVIRAKIKINDSTVKEIEFTVLILNNTTHAGDFPVFPTADLTDSLLNLVFAKTNALTQCLFDISVLTQTYFYDPGIRHEISRLNIILDKPALFMLDGELFGSVDEVTYSVAPAKLKILML